MATQEAYLLVRHSPGSPAHHSFFIPAYNTESSTTSTGKLITVKGDTCSGFHHRITRFYNPSTHTGNQSFVLLGTLDTESVNLAPTNVGYNTKTKSYEWHKDVNPAPIDKLEKPALGLPAPTQSFYTISPSRRSKTLIPTREKPGNCQTWMKDYVDLLVREEVLGEGAREVLDVAAKS